MNYGLMILYIVVFIELLIAANIHGTTRSPNNFYVHLINVIITLILVWWALGWQIMP